jgi:acetoin utilization protein AcuB
MSNPFPTEIESDLLPTTTENDPFPADPEADPFPSVPPPGGAYADAALLAATAAKAGPEVVELEPSPAEPPPPPPAHHRSEPPAPLSVHGGIVGRQWPPRVLADLMTRQIIAVGEDELLGDLEGGMKRFRFRHLPVVSEGRKLVGLISRSDFLHALLGTTPSGQPIAEKVDASTPARAIMRRSVVTARVDTSIETACRVMLQEKLTCLPIVTDDSTLVGIVTETDFVKLTLELIERGSS